MSKKNELPGQKFGKLLVVADTGIRQSGAVMWECQCDCGKRSVVRAAHLISGATRSCGCDCGRWKRDPIAAKYPARLRRVWKNMKQRCYNPKSDSFKCHGEKGVVVCEEWERFVPFAEWAINNGYQDHLTLDRIDNDGNYEPSNCRWATMKEQQNNRGNNRRITFNEKTQTMAMWAEELGVSHSLIYQRIRNGMSVEEALAKPKIKK